MDDDIFDDHGRIRGNQNMSGFNEQDYDLIKDYLLETTGISLGDTKKNMAYTRLSKHIQKTGLRDLKAYLDLVKRSPVEWQQFVNALTTNLTSFFREPHHFAILRSDLKKKSGIARNIQVWCAASSTGEEVWSIAMSLAEAREEGQIDGFSILATDIDTSVLELASIGRYSKDSLSTLSIQQKQQYFEMLQDGSYQVSNRLRSTVKFMQLNLIETQWPIFNRFDYIFCRNVLIYFERPLQIQVFNQLANYIRPDGLLFIGHSENFVQIQSPFKLLGRTVYERSHS